MISSPSPLRRPASNDNDRNEKCSLQDLNQSMEDEPHPHVTDSPPKGRVKNGSGIVTESKNESALSHLRP